MTDSPIDIRQARHRDVSAIYDLILTGTRRGKILKRSRTDLRRAVRHFWVAEDEGGIVACCALEVYNRKLAEIRSLAVSPKHQGRGIASSLVQHCLKQAKKRRIYEVLAITDRENIFRRHGFSEQLHGQKALFLRP